MAKHSDQGGSTTSEGAPGDTTWPPSFPHRAIDELLARLERLDTTNPAEAHRLLGAIAKEAQRLRTTVFRLSAARLAEADQEARTVLRDALGQADSMRSMGLKVLMDRLDEAEDLMTTMREAFRVELRAAELAASVPDPATGMPRDREDEPL